MNAPIQLIQIVHEPPCRIKGAIMYVGDSNEREAFQRDATAISKELAEDLLMTKAGIGNDWDELEKGRQQHHANMGKIGVKPRGRNNRVLALNIGGSHASVHLSVIEEAVRYRASVLGSLFEGSWDQRVPRDTQGRIVLDESPGCVQHIIHTLLDSCSDFAGGKAKATEDGPGPGVSPDEAQLLYVGHVLGLLDVVPAYPKRLAVIGGSEACEPLQLPSLTTCIRSWLPGDPTGLKLLYRASRDGLSAKSFRDCAGSTPRTVTLIRVGSGDGRLDCVVGGYSDRSWNQQILRKLTGRTPDGSQRYDRIDGHQSSDTAFVFMLLDSSNGVFDRPVKWGLKAGKRDKAVYCGTPACRGPWFGSTDLGVNFGGSSGCTLQTGREVYGVAEGSTFLNLNGGLVADIEVYAVTSGALATPAGSHATPPKVNISCNQSINMRQTKASYTRKFGTSIGRLLVEERRAIAYAQAELDEAKRRAAAAARALRIVYGPDVASGKEDEVLELKVREMSVTTLRSTLEVCPDSVFIAWFADRWSGGNGKDEDGRYKIDCDPASFSKILDVLRMRKRAGWAERDDEIKKSGAGHTVRVHVSASRFADFEKAVDMYFPNCTGFIMDLVKVSSAPATSMATV